MACMCREADEFDENMILRSEIADFSDHSADIMVAPAQAIERGYNIVDKDGHSAFGSVFFLVRPMEVPDEISSKCTKLNGYLERHCVLSGRKTLLTGRQSFAVKPQGNGRSWNVRGKCS